MALIRDLHYAIDCTCNYLHFRTRASRGDNNLCRQLVGRFVVAVAAAALIISRSNYPIIISRHPKSGLACCEQLKLKVAGKFKQIFPDLHNFKVPPTLSVLCYSYDMQKASTTAGEMMNLSLTRNRTFA